MAPAEATHTATLNQEALLTALEGRSDEEMQEMARRLQRSDLQFKEMYEEMQAEQQELKDENKRLNETIALMMAELRKLNIGATNTVEPRLDENPLNVVGRIWERVKPRDTAFLVDEHVGEIRKPVPRPDDVSLREEIQQELGKHVAQRFAVTFGPMWQKAEGLVSDARNEVTRRIAEHQKQSASPEAATDVTPEAQPTPISTPENVEATVEATADVPQTTAVAEDAAVVAGESADPAAVPETEEADEEEQIPSSILIEAQVTLDDGSTQTLVLRATDRCKEVADTFVKEHSLKAWFKDPLTKWLKQVEADAVKFPVEIQGDLMEIRKEFSKK